jgi:acetoin utilization deacetylase AcuC-like enzyme
VRKTAFVTHPEYLHHDAGFGHPERPARLQAILDAVDRSDLDLLRVTPEPIDEHLLHAVHDEAYVERIRLLAQSGGGSLDPDTVVSEASYRAALLAAGGAVEAVDRVLRKETDAAFAAVRPPGHHALRDRGMGFCLFNNVACAAISARNEDGIGRTMILDWDVHHGNGTQEIFFRDGSVLYVSVHQEHWYPGTGRWDEVGSGVGEGFTLNIPLPAGTGDEGYRLVFEEVVVPLGAAFRPELMLISAGYDAHFGDPLGGMLLSTVGFTALTRLAVQAAGEGRVVGVLEGGYHLRHLAGSVVGTLAVLTDRAVPTADEHAVGEEIPYRVIQERVRHARSIARNYWNI